MSADSSGELKKKKFPGSVSTLTMSNRNILDIEDYESIGAGQFYVNGRLFLMVNDQKPVYF